MARANFDAERMRRHYRTMARIRAFEEAAEAAQKSGAVKGAVHLSIGQEGVASGVCINLRRDDYMLSTHRGHGHTIAKGADPGRMMMELMGKGGGYCQGKGGSMHIADFSVGMLGANGVVAANIAIGVGAAHGAKLKGEDKVVVCFFGDGAINRGPFLEGLNWAKVFELPILFVCEDNGFAATTRTEAMSAGPGPDARARSLGVPATACDGNDVGDVDATASELLQRVRGGAGPQFLLARTYRLKGHTAADAAPYRPASEVEEKLGEDPLARCGEALRVAGVAANELVAIEEEARAEIARAVAAAEGAAWPDQALAFADVQDVGRPAWRR